MGSGRLSLGPGYETQEQCLGKLRPLLALVQQGAPTVVTEQLARVERLGEQLVDGNRQRVHVDDLRLRADARGS